MDSDDLDALCRGISSSPPEPPSPPHSNESPPELSSPSPECSLSAISSNPQKQSFQDFSQYATSISRSLKLPKTDSDQLAKFANLDVQEKLIWLAGYSLKMVENQALMARPNVVYNIPKTVKNSIDHYSFIILMDPTIAAYVAIKIGPAVILQDLLEDNLSWGLIPAVKDDKTKLDTVMAHVRDKLTKCCADMKKVLIKSMGTEDMTEPGKPLPCINAQDIVTLCQELADIYECADIIASVPLCTQVVFLCCVLKCKSGVNYWDAVDLQLHQ